jgi:hypothetical protein
VGVAEEFQALKESVETGEDYSHQLIGFRSKYVLNSFGRTLPAILAKSGTTNPAHIHPDDLAAMNITDELFTYKKEKKKFVDKVEAKTIAITEFIENRIHDIEADKK